MNLIDYERLKEMGFSEEKPWFYVAGSLTGISPERKKELDKFYEDIATVVRKNGGFAYLPHKGGTDPVKNPDILPADVYETDIIAVEHSKNGGGLIAYVGEPSTGVGIEIQHANLLKIPVILLYEVDKKVTRLAKGIPNLAELIIFDSKKDALKRLDAAVAKVISSGKPSDE